MELKYCGYHIDESACEIAIISVLLARANSLFCSKNERKQFDKKSLLFI